MGCCPERRGEGDPTDPWRGDEETLRPRARERYLTGTRRLRRSTPPHQRRHQQLHTEDVYAMTETERWEGFRPTLKRFGGTDAEIDVFMERVKRLPELIGCSD
jgi:hypothetical protein